MVRAGLVALIVATVAGIVLETVEPFHHLHGRLFLQFELASVAVFGVEYVARLWGATASPREDFHHPFWGRLRFAMTPAALVDLAAILPVFLLVVGIDVGFLRIVRVLRALKLVRHSPAMTMLARVVHNERKSLGGVLLIFVVLLFLTSTMAYWAERAAQPATFGSIPLAMWWAMAALTTVGYGDVTPITLAGRVIGGLVVLLGIVVIALPTGIIASAFVEEAKRRDFVVTWSLLAEIPFFQELKAARIADLAQVLKPRFVQAKDVIVRKGDTADSMFIIAEGEVEVDLGAERAPVILRRGQFFGEMALLERVTRTATVRGAGDCRLLELQAKDFAELLEDNPELGETVTKIANERKSR